MAVEAKYRPDVETILAYQDQHGAALWSTEDKKLIKGGPFSTLESAAMLLELGMEPDDPLLLRVAELIFSTQREDGRFQLSGKGAIYPCHTTHVASVLCRLGYAQDERVEKTLRHLLESQYSDGGWRCNKFSFGRGPETEHSNPLPTLLALDAFRQTQYKNEPALEKAVEFLLQHWVIRAPIGPCHYGIGTLFMQVSYPFRDYNLFYYVYVLSHYRKAVADPRLREALAALRAKTVDGQMVVERVAPKLGKLSFCKKGQPSELATRRWREILLNAGEKE